MRKTIGKNKSAGLTYLHDNKLQKSTEYIVQSHPFSIMLIVEQSGLALGYKNTSLTKIDHTEQIY